jgi:excisionase family DNA binding protein
MGAIAEKRNLMTTAEVAAELRVSPDTVRRLERGALPSVRFTARSRLRFRSDDVERLIEGVIQANGHERP